MTNILNKRIKKKINLIIPKRLDHNLIIPNYNNLIILYENDFWLFK